MELGKLLALNAGLRALKQVIQLEIYKKLMIVIIKTCLKPKIGKNLF